MNMLETSKQIQAVKLWNRDHPIGSKVYVIPYHAIVYNGKTTSQAIMYNDQASVEVDGQMKPLNNVSVRSCS